MEIVTAASSDDEQLYARTGRRVAPTKGALPKAFSLPVVQMAKDHHDDDEPHYAIPPSLEQPRDVGPEVQDIPATIVAKRIFLTSVNQSKELRCSWIVLAIHVLLASALLALGAYHVIEAHRDAEDAPNTLLSEPVAVAPAPAVSLYFEAVSILQLSLIMLFTGALGFAAYFPHGIRQPAKMAFLIFVCISIHLALSSIASIAEEIAHRINLGTPNDSYRVAELCVLIFLVLCLAIASYPACGSLILYRFEKQSSRFLRVLCFFANAVAVLVFLAHAHVCAVAVNRGYNGFFISRFSSTVRLSYAVCAMPASLFGVVVALGTFKMICRGSRPIGVWVALMSSAALLVMYNMTPLLAGLYQDAKGDFFDFIYLIQFILHGACILAWTMVIGMGTAYAYVR